METREVIEKMVEAEKVANEIKNRIDGGKKAQGYVMGYEQYATGGYNNKSNNPYIPKYKEINGNGKWNKEAGELVVSKEAVKHAEEMEEAIKRAYGE